MTDVLDQVVKLIALATSPNDNEARNAAMKACALVREHKLVVVLPGDPRAAEGAAVGRRRRKTVIVHRCAACGTITEGGGLCEPCLERRRTPAQGVWTVDCERCGRSTPPAASEMRADQIALELGYRFHMGQVLCPRCIALYTSYVEPR